MAAERNGGACGASILRGALALCLGGLMAAGCTPIARVDVSQPAMQGRQRELSLATRAALYGYDDADSWHVLLRFPLPGASTGDTFYVLYLHVPDASGNERVAYSVSRTAPARGFFYQARGAARGREMLVNGFVWLKRAGGRTWQFRVDLTGELNTRIRGEGTLRLDQLTVRDYVEAHHAGDVAELLKKPPIVKPREPKP